MFSSISADISLQAEELFHLLYTRVFDSHALRMALASGKYTPDDVNRAAIEYIDNCPDSRCSDNYGGTIRGYGETVPGYEDSHITEALDILLDYGLDPNMLYPETDQAGKVIDHWNIMDSLWCISNGYQAADALCLLLTHGGDPRLMIGGRSLLGEITSAVEFETDERENINDYAYDAMIHYWLVLVGFSALEGKEDSPLDPVRGFDLSLLRNHRDYYCGKIFTKESNDGWQLCVFDRHTNREVARF